MLYSSSSSRLPLDGRSNGLRDGCDADPTVEKPPTDRDSISLLQALVSSPYAAARALQQLATEDESRELRPDELRYALSMLDSEQLLCDLPPTVGRIVRVLLIAENRLSQRDLADRADVSARTIRNYRNRLEAFDLIRVDENRYRLALSFQTTSERRDSVVPTVLEENQTLLDAADALLETILPPDRYDDLDDPLGSTLFWPLDPSHLLDHSAVGPWLQIAAALTATAIDYKQSNRTDGPTARAASALRLTHSRA